MAIEQTLSILKPDAVRRELSEEINLYITNGGLKIVESKKIRLSKQQAEEFYAVHQARPFFNDLVKTMTSGEVIVQLVRGENAVAKYREIMGATDPKNAEPKTIRKDFALNIEENSVHGSDSHENAAQEIAFFFGEV